MCFSNGISLYALHTNLCSLFSVPPALLSSLVFLPSLSPEILACNLYSLIYPCVIPAAVFVWIFLQMSLLPGPVPPLSFAPGCPTS